MKDLWPNVVYRFFITFYQAAGCILPSNFPSAFGRCFDLPPPLLFIKSLIVLEFTFCWFCWDVSNPTLLSTACLLPAACVPAPLPAPLPACLPACLPAYTREYQVEFEGIKALGLLNKPFKDRIALERSTTLQGWLWKQLLFLFLILFYYLLWVFKIETRIFKFQYLNNLLNGQIIFIGLQ